MTSCTGFSMCWRNTVFPLLCLAALLLSCSGDSCVSVCDQDGSCPKRPHPNDLLNFFAAAYVQRDIDGYGVVLSEFYEFEFVPDIAESLGLSPDKPWWGREEDIASTQNMFNDPDVAAIEMGFEPWGVSDLWTECEYPIIREGPAEPETTWFDGLCKLFVPDIKVHIEEPGEDILTLWVNDSVLEVVVIPDLDCPGDWVILRIVETPAEPLSMRREALAVDRTQGLVSDARPSSWSLIKYIFRQPR